MTTDNCPDPCHLSWIKIRAVDPRSFFSDPDPNPAVFLNADPDPDVDPDPELALHKNL